MGRDKTFTGSYETSRYGKQSLEEDIIQAGNGVITKETSTGGLYRETDSRIDVWGKGSPGNYDHHYYNNDTKESGTRSGKR